MVCLGQREYEFGHNNQSKNHDVSSRGTWRGNGTKTGTWSVDWGN